MKISIRHVSYPHYVCQLEPSDKLCDEAYNFWKNYLHSRGCEDALIVTREGQLVAFLRYDIHLPTERLPLVVLYAIGTWVHSDLRRQGVGFALWDHLIKHHNPDRVYVSASTLAGSKFIRALHDRWPDIDWRGSLNVD